EVLRDFIRLHPGRRPNLWWRFESSEPRRRLGGIGDALMGNGYITGNYTRGIPLMWGNRLPSRYRPIDPTDPPQFESQAIYLQRLGLLPTAEPGRLSAKDFEPELVLPRGPRPPAPPAGASPRLRAIK